MGEIQIRQVRIEDLDSCCKIESRCFPSAEAATLESIEKRILTYPQGFFVAEINGIVVGIINSAATDKDDITDEQFKKLIGHIENGKNIVIFSVAVLPEFQRMGISKKLMLYFINQSKKLQKEKVLLICKDDLLDYYKKLGYQYTGKSNSTHGGVEWNEMALYL